MTEPQHDERLARRIRVAEDHQRPRTNPDDERVVVRPRAIQEDDVENNQSSAAPTRDGN